MDNPVYKINHNFLEDVGIDLNDYEEIPRIKSPKIHKEMQSKLDYIYQDRGMTVISEEASKQFTEFNFGTAKQDKPKTNSKKFTNSNNIFNSNSNTNKRIIFSSGIYSAIELNNKNNFGKSIDDLVILNQLKTKIKKPKGRMAISAVDQIRIKTNFNKNKLNVKDKDFKSEDLRYRMFNLNLSPNKEKFKFNYPKNLKKLESEKTNLKFNQPKFPRLESVEYESFSINSFPNSSKLQKIKNKPFQFDVDFLPKIPSSPNYVIDILKKINQSQKVHKKEALTQNVFFRLDCGLFYEGDLQFGKLQGQGSLLLKSIDLNEGNLNNAKEFLLYKGEFKSNEVEGKGRLCFQNGWEFEGAFKGGVAHGFGRLKSEDQQVQVEGVWINGIFCK